MIPEALFNMFMFIFVLVEFLTGFDCRAISLFFSISLWGISRTLEETETRFRKNDSVPAIFVVGRCLCDSDSGLYGRFSGDVIFEDPSSMPNQVMEEKLKMKYICIISDARGDGMSVFSFGLIFLRSV